MANESLGKARLAKNDEFYTQYADIEKEMNAYLDFDPKVFKGKVVLLPCDDPEWSNFTKYFAQNFDKLGLKKLISTSYAPDAKPKELNLQLSLFEQESPKFDKKKARTNGRIFTLERDRNNDEKINFEDIEWDYLKGDGDFRSAEVKALRDEADIIITNPPFSLFRDFLGWIMEAGKQFVIIGNMNAITYKEVFPLIMRNEMWLGQSITSGDREFGVPDSYPLQAAGWRVDDEGRKFIRVKGVRWFTNLDHGRRHEPLQLMTKAENKKFSRHSQVKGVGYKKYDNYDAIEVPFTDAIPSDHDGAMGVPISFLDKYNPEQFEILDANNYRESHQKVKNYPLIKDADGSVNGVNKYVRILIRHRRVSK
jgi:Adenine-specific methyltransferase EcoRI